MNLNALFGAQVHNCTTAMFDLGNLRATPFCNRTTRTSISSTVATLR